MKYEFIEDNEEKKILFRIDIMFEQAKELIKNIKIEKDFRISVSRQNKNIASIRPITFMMLKMMR